MFNGFYLKLFILLFKHSLLLYSPLFFTVHNNQQYFQNPLLYKYKEFWLPVLLINIRETILRLKLALNFNEFKTYK